MKRHGSKLSFAGSRIGLPLWLALDLSLFSRLVGHGQEALG
jgi:hypothetical protein